MRNLSLSVLIGVALAGLCATVALAESPFATTPPTIYLDYSNVIAAGSTIVLNRLPIKLTNGRIIYKDVTIPLKTDANGLLSVLPIVQTLSPPILSANFKAGIYLSPSASTIYGFGLTGPGVVPGSVMNKWEVNPAPTKNPQIACGIPTVFYVGPLSNNPFYAARLKPAGITNTEYSYGIVGFPAQCNTVGTSFWGQGAIVGFSQSGSQLSIATFTDSSKKDHNVPVATYTYSLQAP